MLDWVSFFHFDSPSKIEKTAIYFGNIFCILAVLLFGGVWTKIAVVTILVNTIFYIFVLILYIVFRPVLLKANLLKKVNHTKNKKK